MLSLNESSGIKEKGRANAPKWPTMTQKKRKEVSKPRSTDVSLEESTSFYYGGEIALRVVST